MKKRAFFISVLVLGTFFSLLANSFVALTNNVTIIATSDSKKVSVVFEKHAVGATIVLQNEKGVTVWRGEMKDSQKAGKLLDLTALPLGEYELTITTALKEIVQPLTILENSIAITDYLRKEYFMPFIKVDDSRLDLTFMNGRVSDIAVSILDKSGEPVHTELHEGVFRLNKRYQLKNLQDGKYTMVIKTSEKTYYKPFELSFR